MPPLHHETLTRLTSEGYRTRIKIPSGGVGQIGRVGMNSGKLLCGFASFYWNENGGECCEEVTSVFGYWIPWLGIVLS